jgi:hypothetical protein
MKKRGISAVVATVLIILITVAAVTIIWAAVIPMIKEKASVDKTVSDLLIDSASGYTFYDSSSGNLSVQIKRGASSVEIIGVQILVEIDGDTEKYSFYSFPEPNERMIYELSVTSRPESISIAPLFEGDKPGPVSSKLLSLGNGDASLVNGVVPSEGGGESIPANVTYYYDGDEDGWGNGTSQIFPNGTETSGYFSNVNSTSVWDCNDSSNAAWRAVDLFVDSDGDGYGVGVSSSYCIGAATPVGYSEVSGDCDGGDDLIYPGANESHCNGIDENCDGYDNVIACCILNVPGANYLLDNDIIENVAGSCFTISNNSVLFNLGGNQISPLSPGSGTGITILSGDNVQVSNGSSIDFIVGLKVETVPDNVFIHDLFLSGGTFGLWVVNNNGVYEDLTVRSSVDGLLLQTANNNSFTRVSSCGSSDKDIYFITSNNNYGSDNQFDPLKIVVDSSGWPFPTNYTAC